MGTERGDVDGEGEIKGRSRGGGWPFLPGGPEELVGAWVPPAGEDNGGVRATPEQGSQGLWAARLAGLGLLVRPFSPRNSGPFQIKPRHL